MDLCVEIKNTKIVLSWEDIGADYYKIFYGKDGVFYEVAKLSNMFSFRFSLLPYGDHECYIQAFRNDIVIDQSSIHKFKFDTIDIVYKNIGNDEIKFLYSIYEGAEGYRLYKNKDESGFNGCKNSDTGFITVKKEDKSEYKIKPFKQTNGEREFLASSPAICVDENVFENLSVNTSYNYNLFLSWNFKGDADGFLIYAEHSDFPIYEINDNLQHYLTLYDYKGSTKFTIKAFINTLNGKVILAESPKVSLKIRKYKKPLVSLIVPAYNAQDYIIRSIDSALASDFSDLEIIIVNDGSTDDTQKIINWYAKNYSNVVSVEKENGGVADARNKGIEIAKGDYIAFMDNDDLIRPDMISKLYNTITKNKCDVAIAPLYRITDNGYTQHCKLPFIEDIPLDIDKYFEIMYTPGYYNCAIWNKLYKASIVKAHPLGILKYEDVSWTPCILSYVDKFCFLNTPFYEWDRKTRPETFGDVLARQSEEDLFENRKQAMLFFLKNGNPEKINELKEVAKRRLMRYAKNSPNSPYHELIKKIDSGKY